MPIGMKTDVILKITKLMNRIIFSVQACLSQNSMIFTLHGTESVAINSTENFIEIPCFLYQWG